MTYKAVFVDDNMEESKGIASLLEKDGELEVEPLPLETLAKLAKQIFTRDNNLIALDYRLDEKLGSLEPDQAFKASPLAQHLRDFAIESPQNDTPIVLFSAEENIINIFGPDKTAHDLFDRVYTKSQVNDDLEQVQSEMIALCLGYEHLKKNDGQFVISELMSSSDVEDDILDIQEIKVELDEAKAPHLAAMFILKKLVLSSGILIDWTEVCARLGISHEGFENVLPILQEKNLQYDGIFSQAWPRWWSNRIDQWLKEIFNRRATGMTAAERVAILNEKFGLSLEPALSPWNKQDNELIAFACACCNLGTEQRHSLGLFTSSLPKYLNRPRVCWRCVAEDRIDNARPQLIISDTDYSLIEEIKHMKHD